MNVILIIAAYFLIMNMVGFTIMGIDKLKARKHAWRIPESTLLIVAIIGGSIGSICGMFLFRHKTRHWYFRYGLPAILLLQCILAIVLYYSPIQFEIM